MSHTDYTGQLLDNRYAVEHLLGKGGMGAVYQGRHTVIGRRVAIKFLHAELAENEDVVKRFYREAQAAAAIGHRNIIEVLDVGVSARNEPYIVMEYLEGESLGAMLARVGHVDLAAACGVLEPTLLALHAAHERGIVHRDLKPDNIFLSREAGGGGPLVKVIDFGISKFTQTAVLSQLTQTGTLLGTPSYMSPEQARGDKAMDHRTDIYALGVILYQMLTGGLPFTGEHYNELLIKVLADPPRPPRELNEAFPGEAEALVMRCLAKDPAERPQTALAMLEEIKGLGVFAERGASLTLLAAGAEGGSFAAGNLGPSPSSQKSGRRAAQVLAAMQATPSGWKTSPGGGGRRRAGIAIGVGAVVVAVAAAAIVALTRPADVEEGAAPGPTAQRQAATAPAVPRSEPERAAAAPVRITVEGAPEGAAIFYDGVPVPANPFPVERRETMVKLEVKAEGFEPFVTAVIPNADATVKADLKPADPVDADPRRKPTRAAEDPPPSQKQKFKDGKAGSKVGTDFE